jgi:hypothetical protein
MSVARRYKLIGLAVVVVLAVAAQLFQPRPSNPPIDPARTLQARLNVPPDVSAILDRSCRDCHTHATTWPWYAHVSPVSWLVVSDVNEGRDHLNLSEWAKYDARRADHELDEICEHVRDGEMPLGSYTLLHPDAKLSADDVRVICAWTERMRSSAEGAPADGAHAPDTDGDDHGHDDSGAPPHTHGSR